MIRRDGPSALLATPMTPAAVTSPTPIQKGTRTSRAAAARAGIRAAMTGTSARARAAMTRAGSGSARVRTSPVARRRSSSREYLPVRVVLLDGADEENAQGLGGGEDAGCFGAPAR